MRIETELNYPDDIVPNGETVKLNVKITNLGPSESGRFRFNTHLCKPPECVAEKQESTEGLIIAYNLPIEFLRVGESISENFDYGFRVEKEGNYKLLSVLNPIDRDPPPRCGNNATKCYEWGYEDFKQASHNFQVVSLDTFNIFDLNKRIERLTRIVAIIGIVTLFAMIFNFKIEQFLRRIF